MIDVIAPAYNVEKYIHAAIQSVLAQTHKDFNFYIMDDGSTDNTALIIKMYARIDNRINVVYTSEKGNQGVTKCLNFLLRMCENEYVFRFDMDDICYRDRFEKQVKYLDNNKDCVALGSRMLVIDQNGNGLNYWCDLQFHYDIVNALLDPKKAGEYILGHSVVAFRREALRQVNGYNEEYKYAQDLDLYLRLIENGGKVANLPESLIQYRLHPEGVWTKNFEAGWYQAQRAVYESRRRRGLRELPIEPLIERVY
jgi:glycosyltransferase involved in cell wall biosynthesis